MIAVDPEKFKEKLKSYCEDNIIASHHAIVKADSRGLNLNDIKNNLMNPARLKFVEHEQKKRYACYFGYSNTLTHKYVINLNSKIVIITVMKIKRKWQRRVEKHAKIRSRL